jgi:hypothetical protein
MIERIPSTGSCIRCQGALGLTAVKLDGQWVCSPACADGEPRPGTEHRDPVLYNRPRRYFRRRLPKELNAADREA